MSNSFNALQISEWRAAAAKHYDLTEYEIIPVEARIERGDRMHAVTLSGHRFPVEAVNAIVGTVVVGNRIAILPPHGEGDGFALVIAILPPKAFRPSAATQTNIPLRQTIRQRKF